MKRKVLLGSMLVLMLGLWGCGSQSENTSADTNVSADATGDAQSATTGYGVSGDVDAATVGELETLFTDTAQLEEGTAGSSLKTYIAATDYLSMAEELNEDDSADMTEAVAQAYAELDAETQELFLTNFKERISDAVDSLFDGTADEGALDDAGVAEDVEGLLAADGMEEAWNVLKDAIYTLE